MIIFKFIFCILLFVSTFGNFAFGFRFDDALKIATEIRKSIKNNSQLPSTVKSQLLHTRVVELGQKYHRLGYLDARKKKDFDKWLNGMRKKTSLTYVETAQEVIRICSWTQVQQESVFVLKQSEAEGKGDIDNLPPYMIPESPFFKEVLGRLPPIDWDIDIIFIDDINPDTFDMQNILKWENEMVKRDNLWITLPIDDENLEDLKLFNRILSEGILPYEPVAEYKLFDDRVGNPHNFISHDYVHAYDSLAKNLKVVKRMYDLIEEEKDKVLNEQLHFLFFLLVHETFVKFDSKGYWNKCPPSIFEFGWSELQTDSDGNPKGYPIVQFAKKVLGEDVFYKDGYYLHLRHPVLDVFDKKIHRRAEEEIGSPLFLHVP